MDKIDKFLSRRPDDERRKIEEIISRILRGNLFGVDIKKLKGASNLYRARKGSVRIIYTLGKDGKITIIDVAKRSDTTYDFL